MADKKQWIPIIGPVSFIAENKEKGFRKLSVSAIGHGKRVYCTVWDESHGKINIERNDWVLVEGPLSVYTYEDDEGNKQESTSISVRRLLVLSPVDPSSGDKPSRPTTTSKKPTF